MWHVYLIWLKQFKLLKVLTLVGSIVVVGVLTHCALLYSMCDLKAVQMNMCCSLFWELMLHVFELGYNFMEATKDICLVWLGFMAYQPL